MRKITSALNVREALVCKMLLSEKVRGSCV